MRKLVVSITVLMVLAFMVLTVAGAAMQDRASADSAAVLTGTDLPNIVDPITGIPSQVRRVYRTNPIPNILKDWEDLPELKAGRDIVVSWRPSINVDPAQLATFDSWCKSVVANGYQNMVWTTVWHEANLHMTLAQWQKVYAAYSQVAHADGVRFGVIFDTYYFNHGTSLDAWMPPANLVDFLAVDLYPRPKHGRFPDPMYQMRHDLDWTAAHGKPLDLAEVGIEPRWYGTKATDAEASQWLLSIENMPMSMQFMSWFQGDGIDIGAYNSALVPAWDQLSQNLRGR